MPLSISLKIETKILLIRVKFEEKLHLNRIIMIPKKYTKKDLKR